METMSDLGFASFIQNLNQKEIKQVEDAKEKKKIIINLTAANSCYPPLPRESFRVLIKETQSCEFYLHCGRG